MSAIQLRGFHAEGALVDEGIQAWTGLVLSLKAEEARSGRKGYATHEAGLSADERHVVSKAYGAIATLQWWQDQCCRLRDRRKKDDDMPEYPTWVEEKILETLVEWNGLMRTRHNGMLVRQASNLEIAKLRGNGPVYAQLEPDWDAI